MIPRRTTLDHVVGHNAPAQLQLLALVKLEMKRTLTACVALLLCGCATAPRTAVRIDVEEKPAARHWRGYSELPRPRSVTSFPKTRAPLSSNRSWFLRPPRA